ncbi:hypothetical protein DFR70_11572 [Nocardia tenerifensis]|uniref:Uncharacterized protein n=1 Tax=Nocardia tenerifensis TaxID=228006 RepID=A0A318JSK9_9NOCA|nr:hypothetical protein [Nocardia tenerifensis]PXX58099.1 hypothetical protein DFR70_11572 [Nocardia tenerifensis]
MTGKTSWTATVAIAVVLFSTIPASAAFADIGLPGPADNTVQANSAAEPTKKEKEAIRQRYDKVVEKCRKSQSHHKREVCERLAHQFYEWGVAGKKQEAENKFYDLLRRCGDPERNMDEWKKCAAQWKMFYRIVTG